MMRKITQERFVFDLPVHGGTAIEFMDPDVVEYMRRVFEDAERYRWVRKARENFDVLARNSEDERWYDLFGDYLDDYIDAAMKREGER